MGWGKIINKEWEYDEQAAIIRGDKDKMENIKQHMDTTEALVTELKTKANEIQNQILDKHAQSLLTNLDNIKIELDKEEAAHNQRKDTQRLTSQGHIPFKPGTDVPKMPGERGYAPSRTHRAIQNDPRAR